MSTFCIYCKAIIYLQWEVIIAIKSVSIRIDEELLNELHRVADYEGRSANSQMLILVRDCVEKYKREGNIDSAHNT